VTFLGKGDSFGELAIMNQSRRENTVVTKEKTEFLVVNADVRFKMY
jgi:CRP-like cAMP-binding protein